MSMRCSLSFFASLFVLIFFASCKKQLAGPRKLHTVGEITYNASTNLIDTEIYPPNDPNIFKMKFERDHDISGDVSGTWQESGAQMILNIDGDFGPSAQFPIYNAYYDTRDFIEVEGHEVNMREFAPKTYYIVETRGYAGGIEFVQLFVFK